MDSEVSREAGVADLGQWRHEVALRERGGNADSHRAKKMQCKRLSYVVQVLEFAG